MTERQYVYKITEVVKVTDGEIFADNQIGDGRICKAACSGLGLHYKNPGPACQVLVVAGWGPCDHRPTPRPAFHNASRDMRSGDRAPSARVHERRRIPVDQVSVCLVGDERCHGYPSISRSFLVHSQPRLPFPADLSRAGCRRRPSRRGLRTESCHPVPTDCVQRALRAWPLAVPSSTARLEVFP